MMSWDISFANPEFFILLLIIPAIVWFSFFRKKKNRPSLSFSSFSITKQLPKTFRQRTFWIPPVLRILVVIFAIIALARPQGTLGLKEVSTEGIDIMLAMDVSTSMMAKDLKPNRMEASKKVAADFVSGRPTDNIGLVIFSGESLSQCPLTTDHSVLLELLEQIKPEMLEDGTAIGDGLATATDRLKTSQAKSKVVILLTDGVNNRGVIFPLTAAEIAKTFGVRVYTIGVGKKGMAETPVAKYPNGVYQYEMREVNIDEKTLKEIAETTGGKYFRATDNDNLASIYSEIDQLEKSIIQVTEYNEKPDLYFPILLMALGFLSLEWILRMLIYKTLP